MNFRRMLATSVLGAVFAVLATTASAEIVMKMGMSDLVGNADKVFRGTVLELNQGTVSAGGAEFPTVVYTIRVEDAFKGEFGTDKDAAIVTVEMLGSIKADTQTGAVRNLAAIDINPNLDVGQTYVLFTSAPSAIGLSTTIGLDQGLFRVFNNPQGREMTANGLENRGLFDGAISYSDLKDAIQAEINGGSGQ